MIPVAKLPLRQRLSLLAIRGGLKTLDLVSTTAAARAAGQLFLRPPPSPYSRNVAGAGERVELQVDGERALAWRYGAGPTVYLLHGWGGRAFQLSSFVGPLVAAGRTAVLLEAPGHGEAGGRQSSVIAFAQTLRTATARFGPAAGVVTHSLGAMSVIVALAEGLPLERVAFLAPGSSLESAAKRFQQTVGLRDGAMQLLRSQMEVRFQRRWEHYSLARIKPTVPLWVVHDREDPEVPLAETQELLRHWPNAQLRITEGLGHYRLLRNPQVISYLLPFLTGATQESPA